MTKSLEDILRHNKFQEPAEIGIIKKYVRDQLHASCQVTTGPDRLIIRVKSAALAATLRMSLHELQKLCATQKKLFIRIE